ncbi:MAG: hypothetical protein D6740_11335 [Alphaproteobacteria bacterium]|nr:MAG: hypothetical protein D6740_11335 [Alphaproteobacteria bacterium]
MSSIVPLRVIAAATALALIGSSALAQEEGKRVERVVIATADADTSDVLVLDGEELADMALAAIPEGLSGFAFEIGADGSDADSPAGPLHKRGPITRKEAEKHWKERFAAFDINHDGKVTADELVTWQERKRAERRRKMAARHLKRFDANGDGVVTAKEFRAFHERHFKQADVNGDGVITPDERRQAIHKRMAELRRKMQQLRREMRRMRMHMMHHMMDGDRDVEVIIERDDEDQK